MTVEEIRQRLKTDTVWWSQQLGVQIADEAGQTLPFRPRWGQLELYRRMDEQRASGSAIRVVSLKSRKVGISTAVQLMGVQRATQIENHGVFTVAHDAKTARVLHSIAWKAYSSLPNDPEVKPPTVSYRTGPPGFIHFGEPSRAAQAKGDLGINSIIETDTAREAEAGRGFTIHTLHCSEVAFYPDVRRKLLGLQNAVADDIDTAIALESTASGHNEFKKIWDDAESGRSDYIAVFIPWWRDPVCTRGFVSEEDRADFISSIGMEDSEEERLVEQFGVTPEQLHWRRWAIRNKTGGDLQSFKAEYPSSPEEAFVATGAMVFSGLYVSRALDATRDTDELAEQGLLKAGGTRMQAGRAGRLEVPSSPLWVPREATGFGPRHAFWRVWEHPQKKGLAGPGGEAFSADGQYVAVLDPADPNEAEGINAAHGLQVIDHKTRMQVAELESFIDADLVAIQLYLAAIYWNNAILAVEVTGGYGASIIRRIYHDYGYNFVYFRRQLLGRKERLEERLGWDTNRQSKGLLEDGMSEALREGSHGLRSHRTAKQLTTFVRLPRRTGPQHGYRADLLMAYMIGQHIAQVEPVRPDRPRGAVSMTGPPRNVVVGY